MSQTEIRLKSIWFTTLGVVIAAGLGYLLSPEFSAFLLKYPWGASAFGILTIVVPELIKYLRNRGIIKKQLAGSMHLKTPPLF